MAQKIHLVVIDPQVDFCDPQGALYVQGAEHDTHRLADMVKRIAPKLDDIHVTLDSHRLIDVAHRFAMVDYVTKGSNPWTEHYSAVCADVPDPSDPGTQINTRFIQTLLEADLVAIAGEAGSHCLANTVRDIARNFGDDSYIQRLVLLEDATCPVPGFEAFQTDFITEMTARGMKITTTCDFLA